MTYPGLGRPLIPLMVPQPLKNALLLPLSFRSQPPFLIPMVYEYYENTGNKTFLQMVLNDLDTEFNFWQTNRSVVVNINGTDHTVYQYNTPSNVPRPESYKEDLATAKNLTSNAARKQLFRVRKKIIKWKIHFFRTSRVLLNQGGTLALAGLETILICRQ